MTRLTGSVALTASLPVEVLMKSAPGHHAHHAGARDIAQRLELAGAEDRLEVRVAAGLAEGAHLVVERLPVCRSAHARG